MKSMDEKSQIEVRVTGERFSLEAIRPRKVTKLLDTLEALVIAIVEHDYPELDLTRDGALGFTSILSGSLVAELHSPHEEVGCAWRKVNHAIEAGDYPAIPPRVTEQLREIIGFNRRNNTEAEFWENNGTRKLLAVVKSDTALPKPHSLRGTTTLYGQLLRIGGENSPHGAHPFYGWCNHDMPGADDRTGKQNGATPLRNDRRTRHSQMGNQ